MGKRRLIASAALLAPWLVSACGSQAPHLSPSPCASGTSSISNFCVAVPLRKLPDGLEYADLVVGTGPPVALGQPVQFHFTLWLANGTRISSTYETSALATFVVGEEKTIKGWDEGVRGMRVGGVRRLIVPPALAFDGSGVNPNIPPNATLVYNIQVVSVASASVSAGPVPTPTP